MKMYFYLLYLSFWCWKNGLVLSIDDRIDKYYVIRIREETDIKGSRPLIFIVSKKPAIDPYKIRNKMKRKAYMTFVHKIYKPKVHRVDFIEEGLCTVC